MMVAVNIGRAIVALLMISHIKTLLLFPEALAMLVLKSGASIASRAIVPKLVDSDRQLVEANSKLALISARRQHRRRRGRRPLQLHHRPRLRLVAGDAHLCGCRRSSAFACPAWRSRPSPPPRKNGPSFRASASRSPVRPWASCAASSGFLSFLLAFELRGGKKGLDLQPEGAAAGAAAALARKANIVGNPGAPKWHFGAVLIVAGLGGLVGSRLAPALRTRWLEERILQGALVATSCWRPSFAAWSNGLSGTLVLTLAIGTGAAAGKLAFDSLIQRDAPDANWGRSFARFEMRFQFAWVLGALVPRCCISPNDSVSSSLRCRGGGDRHRTLIGLRSESGVSLLRRVQPHGPSGRDDEPTADTVDRRRHRARRRRRPVADRCSRSTSGVTRRQRRSCRPRCDAVPCRAGGRGRRDVWGPRRPTATRPCVRRNLPDDQLELSSEDTASGSFGEFDAGQPQPGRVDLGGRGQRASAVPQTARPPRCRCVRRCRR